MRNEILVALFMAGICIIGSIITRNDKKWAAVILFVAAVAGSLVSGMGLRFREIVEGPFGFLDSALCVCVSAIFVFLLSKTTLLQRALANICKIKVKAIKSVVLLLFIAFPAMLTGFSSASVLTTGKLAREALKEGGVSDAKAVSIIAVTSLIGMIMPPNCIPAMIAANGAGSVLPTPYVGFFLPLLIVAIPALIAEAVLACKSLNSASYSSEASSSSVTWKINSVILIATIAAVLVDGLLASSVYLGGLTFIFFVASVLLTANNFRNWKFKQSLDYACDGLMSCIGPVALMLALGSFIEVSSMTGIRGLFSLEILPYPVPNVMLVLMGISLIVGFFCGESLPAFLVTYAVFPIGWLANTVVVTGVASALAVVSLLCFRGGLVDITCRKLGCNGVKYSSVLKDAVIPVLLILAAGIVMVLLGDQMAFLIL